MDLSVERTLILPAPAQEIFSIITDYPLYTRLAPEISVVKVLSRGEREALVEFEAHLIKKFRYTLELKEEPFGRVYWRQREGPFRGVEGSWELKALGPMETEVTYRLEIELGLFTPRFIVNRALSLSLPAMFRRLEAMLHSSGDEVKRGG